jgi:hypothetical protein
MLSTRWMLVVLAACGPGAAGRDGGEGATGAAGPAGPPGPPGPAGGGYRWHDATGAQVTVGPELVIFDANGHLWPLNPETGEVGDILATFWRYGYDGPDCTGTEYAGDLSPPRLVMTGWRNEEPDRLYVRPDDGAMQLVSLVSARNRPDDDCFNSEAEVLAMPASLLVEVTPPATPWTGPLHPEPVE